MAAYTQSITCEQQSISSLLALSYKTFEELGWEVKSAGEAWIIGITPKARSSESKSIFVEVTGEAINISSSALEASSWNGTEGNEKKVQQFIESFESIRTNNAITSLEEWEIKLASLQKQTEIDLANEEKIKAEVEQVMNLSGGSRTATYAIITLNVMAFIVMILNGVGVVSPESDDLIRWGANFSPMTLSGEWWRLISCVFIHIGIIHLLFNMYALYSIGNYLEPMLGKVKYISAYIATGVFASLLSLWWHKDQTISAGASGAIFGLYGVFLALLTTNIIPQVIRKPMLQSIGIFIFYNLAYGMKEGIDNAAHLGGLLSGFAIGYVFYWVLRNPGQKNSNMAVAGVIAASILGAVMFLKINRDDTILYKQKLEALDKLQEQAMKPLNNNNYYSLEAQRIDLEEISLPAWKKSKILIEETKAFNVSKTFKKQRGFLLDYVELRIKETLLFIDINKGNVEAKKQLPLIEEQLQNNIEAMNNLFL
jgi:rhomboid protease GluP